MNDPPSVDDPVQALQAVCKGLLWPSEADCPIEVIHWPASDLTAQAQVKHAGAAPTAPVETVPLADLFRNVVREQSWFGAAETLQAQRFQTLQQILAELKDPQAYRLGEVEVTVYAMGQLTDGSYLGIKTQMVET